MLCLPPSAPGDNACMNLRTIRRALLSVSDKTGLVDLARGLAEPRRRADLHRRHPQGAGRRRSGRARHCRGDRLSRDARRPGQDAAPARPRRHPRRPRQSRSTPRPSPAQGIEPIDLVVCNLYPFEATVARPGSDARGDRREHRHRRPVAWCARRPRTTTTWPSSPTRRSTPRCSRSCSATAAR